MFLLQSIKSLDDGTQLIYMPNMANVEHGVVLHYAFI